MKKFFKVALIAIAVLVGALYVWLNFNVSYELKLACEGKGTNWIYQDGKKMFINGYQTNKNTYAKFIRYEWWYSREGEALIEQDGFQFYEATDLKFDDALEAIEIGSVTTDHSGFRFAHYSLLSKKLDVTDTRKGAMGFSFKGTCTETKN